MLQLFLKGFKAPGSSHGETRLSARGSNLAACSGFFCVNCGEQGYYVQSTHVRAHDGVPAFGRRVARTMIQIFRMVNGKIEEEWNEGGSLLD